MKIQKHNAGALTNFEVLDFLRSRGASKDPSRVMVPIAPSEFKVYDYLVERPACNQTREDIDEFLEKCKPYGLAKAEILNIINVRPFTPAQIYPIIEQPEARLGEERMGELVEMVVQVLPPAPPSVSDTNNEAADVANANKDGAADVANANMDEAADLANANKDNAAETDGQQMGGKLRLATTYMRI